MQSNEGGESREYTSATSPLSLPPSFALQIIFNEAVCPAGPSLALSMVVPRLLPHLFAISAWLSQCSSKAWTRWVCYKRTLSELYFHHCLCCWFSEEPWVNYLKIFPQNMCLLAALPLPMLKSTGNWTGKGRPTHLMLQLPFCSWDKKKYQSCTFRVDTKGALRPHHCGQLSQTFFPLRPGWGTRERTGEIWTFFQHEAGLQPRCTPDRKRHPQLWRMHGLNRKRKKMTETHPKWPKISVAGVGLRFPHSLPSSLASMLQRKSLYLCILKLTSLISVTLKILLCVFINREKIQSDLKGTCQPTPLTVMFSSLLGQWLPWHLNLNPPHQVSSFVNWWKLYIFQVFERNYKQNTQRKPKPNRKKKTKKPNQNQKAIHT